MSLQQEAAKAAMIKWLANPAELGKAPRKIEYAGEFELHGMIYYIYKFKTGIFGKWLVGVSGGYEVGALEHCGHVFSEMEQYSPDTAQEKAAAMVEMLREYWMEQARAMNTEEQFYL